MKRKVIIIGAGGHAKVIEEIIEISKDEFIGFLDDNKTGEDIIGKIKDIEKWHKKDNDIEFIIGIGNNSIRNKLYNEYSNIHYYTAIHPTAVISKNTIIGKGTAIMANAIIGRDVIIGGNCIINTGTIIEHNCIIEDGVHLSYRVTLGAESKIGKNSYIDIGSIINRNVTIGEGKKIEIGEVVRGGDFI